MSQTLPPPPSQDAPSSPRRLRLEPLADPAERPATAAVLDHLVDEDGDGDGKKKLKVKRAKAPAARPGEKLPWYKREYNFGSGVKPDELMNFSRQASSFLRAGIPVLDALTVLAEDNTNQTMVGVLNDIRSQLSAGQSLGVALAQHPKVFPNYYISMVRSAELTGNLDVTLDQLAGYLERDLEAKRKIKSALTYPVVVFVMAMGAVGILVTFVLPRFRDLFNDIDAKLPLSTRALLGATGFFTDYWWVILAGLVAIGGIIYTIFGGQHGRLRRHHLMLRIPGFGELLHYVILERFCRVLASMVGAGVPLPDALAVASDSTNNRVFQLALDQVGVEMVRGAGFAGPIAATDLFPAAARQMIRVGESTGTLEMQLHGAAEFYSRELTYKLKRFTDLFEPMIILAVGLTVGFVAIAMVQAMYGVFDQVKT